MKINQAAQELTSINIHYDRLQAKTDLSTVKLGFKSICEKVKFESVV